MLYQCHYECNIISLTLIKSLQNCSSITGIDSNGKVWTEVFKAAWGSTCPDPTENYSQQTRYLLSLLYALYNPNIKAVLHNGSIHIVFFFVKSCTHYTFLHPPKSLRLWPSSKIEINITLQILWITLQNFMNNIICYLLMCFGKDKVTDHQRKELKSPLPLIFVKQLLKVQITWQLKFSVKVLCHWVHIKKDNRQSRKKMGKKNKEYFNSKGRYIEKLEWPSDQKLIQFPSPSVLSTHMHQNCELQ